jgi:hypothetical protein
MVLLRNFMFQRTLAQMHTLQCLDVPSAANCLKWGVAAQDITPPERVQENPKCDREVTVYGYLRGTNLKPSTRAHLAGVGDLQARQIHGPLARPSPFTQMSIHVVRGACGQCEGPEGVPKLLPIGHVMTILIDITNCS